MSFTHRDRNNFTSTIFVSNFISGKVAIIPQEFRYFPSNDLLSVLDI